MPTNEEVINSVKMWQTEEMLHPLTCGNDSNHLPLEPKEENGKVILVCSECDYTQDFIPPVVASFNGKITNVIPGEWR